MRLPFAKVSADTADGVDTHPGKMLGTSDRPSSWRVWALTASIAAAAVGIAWSFRDTAPLVAPVSVPWWALAAGFFAAEIAVVHLRFRADAHSFSLSEIAFVVGLFFVSPLALLLAQLVGIGAALAVYRRQPPVKLGFNLAQFSLQASTGLVVFRGLVGADPVGVEGLLGALAATLAALVVGDVLINLAIRLSGGDIDRRAMLGVFTLSTVAAGLNTVVGLGVVVLLWVRPGTAWLAAAPAIALYLGYKGYAAHRASGARLLALAETTRALHSAQDLEKALRNTVSRACALFDAELTEIYVFPNSGPRAAYRTSYGPADRTESMCPVDADTARAVWATIEPRDAAAHDNGAGPIVVETESPVRDAIAAPLRSADRPVGAIIVANHLGDLGPFNADDVAALDLVAGHLSLLIDRAPNTAPSAGRNM